MTFGPVVSGSALSEDEVVWTEDLTEWSGTDRVHGSWLQIDEDGAGYIFASGGFVVVDVDSLQLKIGVSVIGSGGVNSMFVRDNFPKLKTRKIVNEKTCHVY